MSNPLEDKIVSQYFFFARSYVNKLKLSSHLKDLLATKSVFIASMKLNENRITRSWYKFGCYVESKAQYKYKSNMWRVKYRRKSVPNDPIIQKEVKTALQSLLQFVDFESSSVDAFLEKFYSSDFTPNNEKELYLSQLHFKKQLIDLLNCATYFGEISENKFDNVLLLSESMKKEALKVLKEFGRVDVIPPFLEMSGVLDTFISGLYKNKNAPKLKGNVSKVYKQILTHFINYYWHLIAAFKSILSMSDGLSKEAFISAKQSQIKRLLNAKKHMNIISKALEESDLKGDFNDFIHLLENSKVGFKKENFVDFENAIKEGL